MHKVLAAVGLAVAVPVALAAPALAKPPVTGTASVSSLLSQHEGFRAEVTYLCTGPKHQEGAITVFLRQPAKPGASKVTTIGIAYDEAKCDGKEREETIKIPVGVGALRADQPVWLHTTLVVDGKKPLEHTSVPEPVTAVVPQPTPSPTSTDSATPSASPTPSSTPSDSATPSASPTPSSTPSDSATPSASATPSSTPSESSSPETPSPSPTATS